MGADISLWVEVEVGNGSYTAVLPDGTPVAAGTDALNARWRLDRNYTEYALLGLSSRRKGVTPLVPVRGLPESACAVIRDDILGYPMVNASWFTAREFREADWERLLPYRVCSDPTGRDRPPETYVAEGEWAVLDRDDAQRFAELDQDRLDTDLWAYPVRVRTRDAAPGLFSLMQQMVGLRPEAPQQVRAVYAFDQY